MVVETKAPPCTKKSVRSALASGTRIQAAGTPASSVRSTRVLSEQAFGWMACIFSRTSSVGSSAFACPGWKNCLNFSNSALAILVSRA